MPRNNFCRLTPNVPQQIALRSDGLPSKSGEEVRFDLVDGRVLLLDLDTATRLQELEVNLEEPFWICSKWTGSPDEAPYIDLWLDPAGEKRRAREEAPELERQLAESLVWAKSRRTHGRKGPQVASRPATVQTSERSEMPDLLGFEEMLVSQTTVMADAYARALKEASDKHGNAVNPEALKSFLITAYIQATPRGWKRSAA